MAANFSSYRIWIADRSSNGPAFRPWGLWAGLVLLLAAELVVLTLPFNSGQSIVQSSLIARFIFVSQRGIRPAFITGIAAAIFFSNDALRGEFGRVVNEPGQLISFRWFGAHLVLLSLLIFGTYSYDVRLTSIEEWSGWLLLWIVIASAALATWLFTALPVRFWFRWISRSRSALIGGAIVGLAAYTIGIWTTDLWSPLQSSTYAFVALILRMLGQSTVVEPSDFVIGTTRFTVAITAHCSGLEGIGLAAAFITLYLWKCRAELRFPNALLLFPIGVVSIWTLNSVRIAALILIGGFSADTAAKGFHSAAGWIFFNFVVVGLIWIGSRSKVFVKAPAENSQASPATKYIGPILAFYAIALIAGAFSIGFEFTGPAIAVAVALWLSRSELLAMRWRLSWLNIGAGALVFALTIIGAKHEPAIDSSAAATLHSMSELGSVSLLLIWLFASAIAIPLSQELAFRGYLARKLISPDFDSVRFTRFTWLSFFATSIAYGITQSAWIPGIVSGMVFGALVYRRGNLCDAVVAHVCSGTLMFLFAIFFGKWSLLG